MINDLLPPLRTGREAAVPSLRVSTWRRPNGQPSLMINDLPTPGGETPDSASSASADKERNNDMLLT